MLVVMGIIVLVILIAIPAIQSITGTRSVGAAQNTLSALITRAREEAVGLQEVRGVLFYLDPANGRVNAAIVRQVLPPAPDNNTNAPLVYLDAVPNRDYLPLPPGVGAQTVINAALAGTNGTYSSDAYLGFNPFPDPRGNASIVSTTGIRYGGVILFDGNGRLVSKTYGFKLFTASNAGNVQSPMGALLNIPLVAGGTDFVPIAPAGYPPPPNNLTTPVRIASQVGLVLYDRQTFLSQVDSGGTANFTDGDPGMDPAVAGYGGYGVPNSPTKGINNGTGEGSEEGWLDVNATPILINRYNGTLIRGE